MSDAPSNPLGPVDAVISGAGVLGCGTYEVYVFPRGGGGSPLIVEIPWATLNWTRVLDDTSDATVSGTLADCCGLLGIIRPWRHEFALYRNGELVWQGPLYNPKTNVDLTAPRLMLDFACRDLSAWWDRRLIHDDHSYTGVDLATIFTDYHDDAMAPDPSPNFNVTASPCGVMADREILAGQYRKAGEELRSISQIGIDWTVVARTAFVGGLVVPTASIGTLTDDHFISPPEPNLDGSQQANRWVVLGAGQNADGTNAVVGDDLDVPAAAEDGLLEEVATDTSIQDTTSAQAAAESRVSLTKQLFGVEEAILSPDAPVVVSDLIPGALCRLELTRTCPPFSGDVRIKKVTGAAGGTVPETISLVFQPEGTS